MTWMRRLLGPIAAVWLVGQAATLGVVPALLEAKAAECTCPLGGDATCPMHQKTGTGSKVCVMHSITTRVPVTLNSLLSVVGVIPDPPLAIALVPAVSAVRPESMLATPRPLPPDPPPPRA